MNKDYELLWNIKNGISPVMVRPVQQDRTKRLGPIIVYKDEFGVTYSAKYIRAWKDLTYDQKKKVYREEYQKARQDALWRIAKDPALEDQFENWKTHNKSVRDNAIARIDAGENVEFVPFYLW